MMRTAVIALAVLVGACKFVDDHVDNCDTVRDSFRVGKPCQSPGVCGEGVVECAGPFSTRCSTGPGGSESRASDELCDGLDNDCDGDRDEGYGVGEVCARPGGCVGRRQCSAPDAGGEIACAEDPTARSQEVCDGLDNDCDGYVDQTLGASQLISACECVEKRLTFGAPTPDDPSETGASPTCPETRCSAEDDALGMSFCLHCGAKSYAMCTGTSRIDVTPFVRGDTERAFTVHFTFESRTDAQSRVNLYYAVDRPRGDGGLVTVRRYFPLLAPGDGPGTYTRRFLPGHTCFAHSDETACSGASTTCPDCRTGETCGTPSGSDCDGIAFTSAVLQVAVEDDCAGGSFQGVVRIHEVTWGPASCAPSRH